MGVRNLSSDVVRGQGLDCGENLWENPNQNHQHHGTNQVKHQVQDGRTLSVPVHRQGCDQVRGYGTDGRTDYQVHRRMITQQPLHRKSLEDNRRRGRTLQQRREGHAEEHRQERIIQSGNHPDKGFALGQRGNRRLHDGNAHEEHSETHDYLAHIFYRVVLDKQECHHAEEHNHRRICRQIEGRNLCRHRGTDVGTHDNAQCLEQGHHSRVNETDYHDIRRRRTLHQNGHHHSHEHRG